MEGQERDRQLIQAAMEARERAYAPYSGYLVGAALLTAGGDVYQGCNIENASYGATNCAERTAFFKAVSQGEREFQAIAIVGGGRELGQGDVFPDMAYPCGICRQVMREFCGPQFRILVGRSVEDYGEYTLEELLPESFGPKCLDFPFWTAHNQTCAVQEFVNTENRAIKKGKQGNESETI